MPYIVHQKIKGRIYAYETVCYWDKNKKSPRQKRRYLGRVDPTTGRIIKPTEEKYMPLGALDYGDVEFVRQCFEGTKLGDVLSLTYGKNISDILRMLSISRVVHPTPMKRVKSWYERTALPLITNVSPNKLSSQKLSNLFRWLGSHDTILQKFFADWIGMVAKGRIDLLYDITSLESNSNQNNMLEYGYSRSNEDLPQLNFGIVINRQNSLPLFYKIFPGSIPDVVTLKNLVEELKAFGRDRVLLILDRGFYSHTNIKNLFSTELSFVIPVPFTTKLAIEIISKHNKDIEKPGNAVMYNKRILYIAEDSVPIDKHNLFYVVYYDKKRAVEEITRFYEKLFTVEKRLNGLAIPKIQNAEEFVREESMGFCEYLKWYVRDSRIVVTGRRTKAISRYLNRKGKVVLISNEKFDWRDMLDYYKSKDDVEKTIESMKSDLEGLPMRTHKAETTKGYLLVMFLSIVLHAYIRRLPRASSLYEKLSLQDLLLELSKIRKVMLRNGNSIITEISKTQRELLEALGIKL